MPVKATYINYVQTNLTNCITLEPNPFIWNAKVYHRFHYINDFRKFNDF